MTSRPPVTRSGEFPTARLVEIERGPQSLAHWHRLFPDDASCRRYLGALRWASGFACPACLERASSEFSPHGFVCCGACRAVCSPTTATQLEKSRIPLRSWLRALWELVSVDSGASVRRLERALPVADPGFVWSWLTGLSLLFRKVWREPLCGEIELVQVPIELGGPRRASALVTVVVEVGRGELSGRARVLRIPQLDADGMADLVALSIARGSTVRTSSWTGYAALRARGFMHPRLPEPSDSELTQAQRVGSILQLWLWSAEVVQPQRLDYYLDEFNFRHDARARGIAGAGALFNAVLRLALEPNVEHRRERLLPR